MNVAPSEVPDQSPCDRVACYACTTDPSRPTRDLPVRAGASIPARFTDRTGHDWVLLTYVTPREGESLDDAIARESREDEAAIAAIQADAIALGRAS